jgi:O-acetyl-ADP-ribose deacetylase
MTMNTKISLRDFLHDNAVDFKCIECKANPEAFAKTIKSKTKCHKFVELFNSIINETDYQKTSEDADCINIFYNQLKERIKQKDTQKKTKDLFAKAKSAYKIQSSEAAKKYEKNPCKIINNSKNDTKSEKNPEKKPSEKNEKKSALKVELKIKGGKPTKLIIGDASITLVKNSDITKFESDFIVNAANRSLGDGGGVNGAIHKAAGPKELIAACDGMSCAVGGAKMTTALKLPSKVIVHTVGPDCRNPEENKKRDELLQKAYITTIQTANNYLDRLAHPDGDNKDAHEPKKLATNIAKLLKGKVEKKKLISMSLPTVSSGIFGFPKEEAAKIALKSIAEQITENQGKATIKDFSIVFMKGQKDLECYEKILPQIQKDLAK